MATEVVGAISINPLEIEHQLSLADFTYPKNWECDHYRGWSHFAVIPSLFNWTVRNRRIPHPDEGIAYLMANCEADHKDDPKVLRRGHKLFFDFLREMHTLGLLQRCPLLGYVEYQKALDLGYNVDYVASLLTKFCPDRQVAIQAAMRANWDEEIWTRVKNGRRERRKKAGMVKEWAGPPPYWLTNRARPISSRIQGCWLFNPEHIEDVAEEIKADFEAEIYGVAQNWVQLSFMIDKEIE